MIRSETLARTEERPARLRRGYGASFRRLARAGRGPGRGGGPGGRRTAAVLGAAAGIAAAAIATWVSVPVFYRFVDPQMGVTAPIVTHMAIFGAIGEAGGLGLGLGVGGRGKAVNGLLGGLLGGIIGAVVYDLVASIVFADMHSSTPPERGRQPRASTRDACLRRPVCFGVRRSTYLPGQTEALPVRAVLSELRTYPSRLEFALVSGLELAYWDRFLLITVVCESGCLRRSLFFLRCYRKPMSTAVAAWLVRGWSHRRRACPSLGFVRAS